MAKKQVQLKRHTECTSLECRLLGLADSGSTAVWLPRWLLGQLAKASVVLPEAAVQEAGL